MNNELFLYQSWQHELYFQFMLSSSDLWKIQELLPICQGKKRKEKRKMRKERRGGLRQRIMWLWCEASVRMYIHMTHEKLSHFIRSGKINQKGSECEGIFLPLFLHLGLCVKVVIAIFRIRWYQFERVLFAACSERLDTISLQAHHAYLSCD